MSLSRRKKAKESKRELTIKQKRIRDLAKIAWAETLKEFYYPCKYNNSFRIPPLHVHLPGFGYSDRPFHLAPGYSLT